MSFQLSELLKLSIPERILLVETLWDSIADESNKGEMAYNLSPEHIAVLEEEMQQYLKNPDEGSTWDEVKQRLFAKKQL